MGDKYIFSNCLGVLVLNPDFSLVETIKIADLTKDFTDWLDEEKETVKKYSKDELFYLGNKKEKLKGIKLTQDPKKIEQLIKFLKTKKQDLFKINLQNTKIKIIIIARARFLSITNLLKQLKSILKFLRGIKKTNKKHKGIKLIKI